MLHHLCRKCVHNCKQDKSVKIVQCPKFQKRLTDDEFRDLLDDLKAMESEVAGLKKRTEALIQKALVHKETPSDAERIDEDGYDDEEEEDEA